VCQSINLWPLPAVFFCLRMRSASISFSPTCVCGGHFPPARCVANQSIYGPFPLVFCLRMRSASISFNPRVCVCGGHFPPARCVANQSIYGPLPAGFFVCACALRSAFLVRCVANQSIYGPFLFAHAQCFPCLQPPICVHHMRVKSIKNT
jgi:hypothetical protein